MQNVLRIDLRSKGSVSLVLSCLMALTISVGCSHGQKGSATPSILEGLSTLKANEPLQIRLKADINRKEQVAYLHRSRSLSYEDSEIRHRKEETLEFTSQAETIKVDPEADRFTQVITVTKKDGMASMSDFAMPEPGEKLEVVADSKGRIYKAGEYPDNSIFFVPPISLPESAVNVGDTWTMQSSWLSLGEMVPYQLDMVSILKRAVKCGTQQCAEIEISGEVKLQGPVAEVMQFQSVWRGHVLFNMDAGTVVWSRVDSEEAFSAGNVRRLVESCLEALIQEPQEFKVLEVDKPKCEMKAQAQINP